MFTDVNIIAVLVAAILHSALRYAWYSPKLFGDQWIKHVVLSGNKINEFESKRMSSLHVLGFVATFVTGFILALFFAILAVTTLTQAVVIGMLIWFGFISMTQLSNVLFLQKSRQLYFIDTTFQMVGMVMMSAIIYLLR